MTSFEIECPDCYRKYTVAQQILGKKVVCANKACGKKFIADVIQPIVFAGITAPPPMPFQNGIPSASSTTVPSARMIDAETRRYRRRIFLLTCVAAVPGMVVLVGLCVWTYFYAVSVMDRRAIDQAIREEAKAFLEEARLAVNAWPKSPEKLLRHYEEMEQIFHRIRNLTATMSKEDLDKNFPIKSMLGEIGAKFVGICSFITTRKDHENTLAEHKQSDNNSMRDVVEKVEKAVRDVFGSEEKVSKDILEASEMILRAEKSLSSK